MCRLPAGKQIDELRDQLTSVKLQLEEKEAQVDELEAERERLDGDVAELEDELRHRAVKQEELEEVGHFSLARVVW